jgi:hypothetical protein
MPAKNITFHAKNTGLISGKAKRGGSYMYIPIQPASEVGEYPTTEIEGGTSKVLLQ